MSWDTAQQKDATLKVVRLWVHADGDATVMGASGRIPLGISGRLVDVLCGPPYRDMARLTYHRAARDLELVLDEGERIKVIKARERVREVSK